MSQPKVAVILLTKWGRDSYRDLTRCFRSLSRVDYPKDSWEIVCVENPSEGGNSWSFIEAEWGPKAGTELPKLTTIKNDRDWGFSGANNIGLEAARKSGHDYVYLLNQDTEVDPLFLKRAVERTERDPKIGLVQSFLLLGRDRNLVNSVGNRFHFLGFGYCGGYLWTADRAAEFFETERKSGNVDLEIPTASGAGLLVRIAMTETTGLFDRDFFLYHEDIDLSFAARTAGWKVVIEPESVVYHHYQFSKSITKFFWMERNRLIVLLSYYRPATIALLFLPILVSELASLPLAILGGGWHREKLRAFRAMLKPSTWKWIGNRRKRIQSFRKIGDREFLRWAVPTIDFQEPGMGGFFMTNIANPLMSLSWRVLYFLIRW
ncbi:glycosyltransferase family 2 protein [Candidatus Uhrbacteria bacterium]|nr:glycosyltransferase family 2 protein [Candidatus Uhrbacteria bacterium]